MTLIALKQICDQLKEAIGLDDEHNVAALIDEDCDTEVKGWTIVSVSNSGEIKPCTSQSFSTIKELMYSWLEKQGEQKPADGQKFKVGDWLVHKDMGGVICCITQIHAPHYYLTNNNSFIKFGEEDNYRPWTIQDAKAGDILSYNDGHGNDCIDLIKSITDKKIEFWFCLTNGNRYEVFDWITPYTNLASREDATPATKEQRDLLFKKIKEAGYEWDAEKKELKKIELATAWSEEDEEELQIALDTLVKAGQHSSAKWLKNVCLRPQTRWKPSEGQMDAISVAVRNMKDSACYDSELVSLYKDLKKLREE